MSLGGDGDTSDTRFGTPYLLVSALPAYSVLFFSPFTTKGAEVAWDVSPVSPMSPDLGSPARIRGFMRCHRGARRCHKRWLRCHHLGRDVSPPEAALSDKREWRIERVYERDMTPGCRRVGTGLPEFED